MPRRLRQDMQRLGVKGGRFEGIHARNRVRRIDIVNIDVARVRVPQIKNHGSHPHICAYTLPYTPRIAASIASSA